jgi:hypothetical protein
MSSGAWWRGSSGKGQPALTLQARDVPWLTASRSSLAGEGDIADKGTSLRFTVCRMSAPFCPHPQPLSHRVGERCRGARLFALPLFSPSPAARERGTQGVRAKERACLAATAHGKLAPAPEILCRGRSCACSVCMSKSYREGTYYANRKGRVYNCPPPLGSPRFARGTEPRARSVPPACRGN